MKLILALVSMAALLVAGTASARQYGVAGCGLGNSIFKKDNQILAATTNGSSGTQMFGITSGTSQCTDGGAVAAAKQVPLFIEANRLALANDMARGSGETIANLSEVMGCANAGQLATVLQQNYGTIFPNAQVESGDVTTSIMNVVKSDSQLDCQAAI